MARKIPSCSGSYYLVDAPTIHDIRRRYPSRTVKQFHSSYAWTSENDKSIIFTSYKTDICYYVFSDNKLVFYENPFDYSPTTTRQVSRWIRENFADASDIIASIREWYENNSGEYTYLFAEYLYRCFRFIDKQAPPQAMNCPVSLYDIVRSCMMQAYYRYNADREMYASGKRLLPDMCVSLAEHRDVKVECGSDGSYVHTIGIRYNGVRYYVVTDYISGTFSIEMW